MRLIFYHLMETRSFSKFLIAVLKFSFFYSVQNYIPAFGCYASHSLFTSKEKYLVPGFHVTAGLNL